MNQIRFLFCLLTCCAFSVSAQTNSPIVSRDLFHHAPVRLRSLDPEPARSADRDKDPLSDSALSRLSTTGPDLVGDFSGPLSLSRRERDLNLEFFRYINAMGYLDRPAPKSENYFTRGLNAVFIPETFSVGKTSVSCSLYTAVKRKNPFCLLNPIFLNVSW